MKRLWRLALVFGLGVATAAAGFGTIVGAGQNAEHERITRHGLSCQYPDTRNAVAGACFEAKSMQELAGGHHDFGAVGAPDRGTLVFQSKAHCDNGDYMNVPGYPNTQQKARDTLLECRAWMQKNMDEAVNDAGAMLDSKGALIPKQVETGCTFVGGFKGRAKCNVLEDMGYMLHAAQDFYSHSNWADGADPAKSSSVENPPGLGHHEPAPFIALRVKDAPFPEGLMTGCFTSKPESAFCHKHVKHAYLNKDEGKIDDGSTPGGTLNIPAGAGTTDRGKIGFNFRNAVDDAVADTRDKWSVLQDGLRAKYGPDKALKMICALRKDDPTRTC
jgi:hypothetical protein